MPTFAAMSASSLAFATSKARPPVSSVNSESNEGPVEFLGCAAPIPDGNEASFLAIDDPNLLLDTWKPAEDGNGTILRFIDLGGEPRIVTIHTPLLSISKIVATDAIERDQKPIVPEDVHTFKIAVRAHQILTVRLILQSN